jgi:hypothetical protein
MMRRIDMRKSELDLNDARKKVESIIIKDQSSWTLVEWSVWTEFLEKQADYFKDEALYFLKENLQQKILLEKYEFFIDKTLGIRNKRIKSKGLFQAPRGRPTIRDGHKDLSLKVKKMRDLGLTWIEVGDELAKFNDLYGTKYPVSERRLRELLKSTEN